MYKNQIAVDTCFVSRVDLLKYRCVRTCREFKWWIYSLVPKNVYHLLIIYFIVNHNIPLSQIVQICTKLSEQIAIDIGLWDGCFWNIFFMVYNSGFLLQNCTSFKELFATIILFKVKTSFLETCLTVNIHLLFYKKYSNFSGFFFTEPNYLCNYTNIQEIGHTIWYLESEIDKLLKLDVFPNNKYWQWLMMFLVSDKRYSSRNQIYYS